MSKDVENLRKHERVLNHIDIIKNKLSSSTDNKIKVGLLEFHPYSKSTTSTRRNRIQKFRNTRKPDI